MKIRFVLSLFLVCFLNGFTLTAIPPADSSIIQNPDKNPLLSKTKDLANTGLRQSFANYQQHQLVLKQSRYFFLIKNEIEEARNFLRAGFKYHEIRYELNQLKLWKDLAVEGVIKNGDSTQTVLNLVTTSRLLNELLNRTNNRLKQIVLYHRSVGRSQSILDSLAMDSILYKVPLDSVSISSYYQKLNFLSKDIQPVNNTLKSSLDSIQELEIQVNLLKFGLESDIAQTEALHAKVFEQFRTNELGSFGQNLVNKKPVSEIISYSLKKAHLVLFFYIVNHLEEIILMFLFTLGIYFYLVILRRKVIKENSNAHHSETGHLLKNPGPSAILLGFTIFQFFLPLPPFIFSGIIWVICTIALSVIIRHSMTRFWFNAWLFFILLFILALISNLILRHSLFEMWSMLILSISGLTAGVFFLSTKRKKEMKEKVILVAIAVMTLLQFFAVYYTLAGGLNLSKILMTNGLFAVVLVSLLYWSAHLANETLLISYYFYLGSEGKKRTFPDENSIKEIPFVYYLLCFAGWFILIGRNTYYFQTMFEPFHNSLTVTRTIGEFSFNYQSILIFFLVLFLSGLISRVVMFLGSENVTITKRSKKGGLGSWLVLIRIVIITAGVLVAFSAAGIPMDRIAIILGAMSVGIGFGLQSLVNNLISGLVIAFEKPVNVGDIVEFAGQTGRMKSIGIRSSVVTTWDGADVIIPNGDILNQQLVNWTLGNSRRRFELLLGVAYGTDLEKVRQLLFDLMMKDNRILKDPQPFVLASKFGNSSVDLSLKFWVAHFDIGFDVKSDLILAIDVLFREHGIEIPFPQQDIHVRALPDPPDTENKANDNSKP